MLGEEFVAECEALDCLVRDLGEADFARVTDFYGWTVRDQVMHLLFLDEVTYTAIEDEKSFLAMLAEIRAYQRDVGELSQFMRERYADDGSGALADAWRAGFHRLGRLFSHRDPKARMKWFGPDMSLRSAASARQMETWAHGQDLYDLFGVVRPVGARIRNICDLGVRTFGWSFVNRELGIPEAPTVELAAPGGELWRWEGSGGLLSGPAADFAAVITQRRNVADTALRCDGEAASRWMEIAQCFAGAPSDAPPPGRGPLLVEDEI